jgi:hypothetical protein
MIASQRKNISANKEQRTIIYFLRTLIRIPILNTDILIRPGVLF